MKATINKEAAERCLTYTRKYLKSSSTETAYLDARTEVARAATAKVPVGHQSETMFAILDAAWLIARFNKTNEAFWQMLGLLGIYPEENLLALTRQLIPTQQTEL